MTRSLLLTCNSRSATISLHDYDHERAEVTHLRDVTLPVPAGENSASPMALSMDQTRVYLAWRGHEKRLLTFALDVQKAGLDLLSEQSIESDICFLHATADGRSLLGAGGEQVLAFPLAMNGLPGASAPPATVGAMAHCVISGKDGRRFATACRDDLIGEQVAGEDRFVGVPQPQGNGPRHLCLSPDGTRLYCVTQESGEVVTLDTEAGLSVLQRLTMADEAAAPMGGDIGITPDGRFLFATERSTNRILAYGVDGQTGLLQPLGSQQVSDYPRALCVGGGGSFVAVLGFRGHRAEIFAIGENGELKLRAGFDTGERPSWMLCVDAA
jgi:6-phosphogluconolactonase